MSSQSSSSNDQAQTNASLAYVPPKVWQWRKESSPSSAISSINRPTAGPRFERDLPRGEHPLQLYSQATPNGQKVTILLEELLATGNHPEAEYDAHLIHILKQDQFSSGFVQVNPNSKIPALVDYHPTPATTSGNDKNEPVQVFESGNILLYLAEKFDNAFLPRSQRTQVLNWLFWQVGSAPYLGDGFGHFYHYAPTKQEYPLERFTMEIKRQSDVLNRQLADGRLYIVGDDYTIADMAIFPWYGGLVLGWEYMDLEKDEDPVRFLNVHQEYPHVLAWARRMASRPAVQRGILVNQVWGKGPHLAERHEAGDIDNVLKQEQQAQSLLQKEQQPEDNQQVQPLHKK